MPNAPKKGLAAGDVVDSESDRNAQRVGRIDEGRSQSIASFGTRRTVQRGGNAIRIAGFELTERTQIKGQAYVS